MNDKLWIKSNIQKPEQGKKVLCFNKGDLDVRQRFKDYWFPIPYVDSSLANLDEPEMWQEIDFPEGFKGYLKISHQGKIFNIDDLEKEYPTIFNEMTDTMVYHFQRRIKEK